MPVTDFPQCNPTIDYSLALSLKMKGFTYREIAAELGCKLGSLKQGFTRKGYTQVIQRAKARIEAKDTNKASADLKQTLASELSAQAEALTTVPASYGGLFNSKDGQGRTSLVKSLAEAAKIVHGWGNEAGSVTFGLVLLSDAVNVVEPPAVDVESSISQTPQEPPVT